jgi:ribonucleoside-diphosphate reductase alpha chain
MKVTKRNGSLENISFDKILKRLKSLCKDAKLEINCTQLGIKVIDRLYDNIETTKIDEFAAEHCATMICNNYDYGTLASYIIISNHQKNTLSSFSETMSMLYQKNILNNDFAYIVEKNAQELDEMIVHERDFLIDYFGFKTLERAYLLKDDDKPMERVQYMWLRTAICIHKNNMEAVRETYNLMSQKFFTHATPTLFNAGTRSQQLSSCFLVAMKEDSVDGIFDTLKECAKISKYAGGIGVHIHNIRAKGSSIDKKNRSNGICPMLRVFNSTARYIDQGGKRNGSIAVYLEPWHYDIEDFLEMRKNHGDEELKARDLFYGLWIPDLFMERIKQDDDWYLFCPNYFPGLSDEYGEKFNELYMKYETDCQTKEGLYKKIKARDLWFKILDSQMETGTPYLLYKDAANKKSNQQNIGTIKSSNLCTEIIEYSDESETAVCNLASIGLPKFVENKIFNYEMLHAVTKIVTNNLNNIIDETFYPCETAKTSNTRHRPIGIGVQGLADVFFLMDVPYHSEEAREINKNIFETMYHAALEKSTELAKEYGCYSTFNGSPASKGILQFDMWGVKPTRYNWDKLKGDIHYQGLRNSLLLAPMPTASTSQILGYNECFEPNSGNIYSRRTLAGEFIIANKYLMKELSELGIWNDNTKQSIIENKGSVQHLDISPHLKEKYKIVWEIPMKHLIDMSVDRGAFICQSQSLNLWVETPNYNILTSMHFYAWSKGLKTGCYYLRRKPTHTAQQFTIEPKECESCSS